MAQQPIPPKQSGIGRSDSKRVEVEFVRTAYHADGTEWYEVARVVTHPDGRTDRLLRVMPTWAIAARMAEYNIDQDEAVRMLIAEPHVERPEALPPVLTDPLWRRGAEVHRQRVKQVTARLGFAPLGARAEDDPLDPTAAMRAAEVPAELISALRLQVADQRQALRERAADPTGALPPAAVPMAASGATALPV